MEFDILNRFSVCLADLMQIFGKDSKKFIMEVIIMSKSLYEIPFDGTITPGHAVEFEDSKCRT